MLGSSPARKTEWLNLASLLSNSIACHRRHGGFPWLAVFISKSYGISESDYLKRFNFNWLSLQWKKKNTFPRIVLGKIQYLDCKHFWRKGFSPVYSLWCSIHQIWLTKISCFGCNEKCLFLQFTLVHVGDNLQNWPSHYSYGQHYALFLTPWYS